MESGAPLRMLGVVEIYAAHAGLGSEGNKVHPCADRLRTGLTVRPRKPYFSLASTTMLRALGGFIGQRGELGSFGQLALGRTARPE